MQDGSGGGPRRLRRSVGLAAATGLAFVTTACGGDTQAQNANAGGPIEAVPVETVVVDFGAVTRSVTVSGIVEPIRTVGVNSQTAGALLAVDVEEGDVVSEGGVLARIDHRELESQLAAAEASFQVAEASYERAEQLRERRVITLPEYERDRTAHAAARAQLEQLRTRIGYATVRSPIAGVVLTKTVEAGDAIGNQTRLFTIGDISTLVVRVGVSELDVVALEVGQRAQVSLDAFPGGAWEGRIRRIFPSADPATRLVPVEVALATEGGGAVRPGYLARVRFDLAGRSGVLVPTGAIVGAAGSESMFVIEDGRAYRRAVRTGLTSEGRIEIIEGAAPGEAVVVVGNNGLRDGADVRVMAGPGAAARATSTEPAPTGAAPVPDPDRPASMGAGT